MDTPRLIENHLDALLDDKLAEEIGATKDRPLHMRVLRVLDRLNEARAENAKLREAVDTSIEARQKLAYAIADQLYHPSNGLRMSREGIAGVVFHHLIGSPV